MTEIAHYEEPATLERRTPADNLDPTGGRLVAWASGLQAAHQLGSALCSTAFAPKHFAGKPEEAAAAILFGDEIGLTPTQALRSIYVIGGAPALYARAMVALVMSHGHRIWTQEDTPTRVTVCGQRRGSKHVEAVTWTTDRARKAGYTSNKKYETDPQAMLYARAAGDVARRIAPDVLAGIAYTVEEMELEETPTTTVKRDTAPTAKRTAKRKPVPEPDLDGDERDAAEAEQASEGIPSITGDQSKKLHATFGDLAVTDRAERLAYAGRVIGRDIESSSDLTKDEASRVIDSLERDLAARHEPELPDATDGDDPWAKEGDAK